MIIEDQFQEIYKYFNKVYKVFIYICVRYYVKRATTILNVERFIDAISKNHSQRREKYKKLQELEAMNFIQKGKKINLKGKKYHTYIPSAHGLLEFKRLVSYLTNNKDKNPLSHSKLTPLIETIIFKYLAKGKVASNMTYDIVQLILTLNHSKKSS